MSTKKLTTKRVRRCDYEATDGMSYVQKIEFYTWNKNTIAVNSGNGKTGKACNVLSFPPALTCDDDRPCKTKCYARKGRQTFPNVCGAYYRNYRLWTEDPQKFEVQLNAKITFDGLPLFRFFDAGDYPDKEFLAMTCRVAKAHPEVKFMAFTKAYHLVNEYVAEGNVIPENYCIRFSAWDKNWAFPNPYNFPVAYVDFSDSSCNPSFPEDTRLCPANKTNKGVTCSACKMCFNSKIRNIRFLEH